MKMYSIVRTRRNTNKGHRYLFGFLRFGTFSEMEKEGKRPLLFTKEQASLRNKQLRKEYRAHNFRMVLMDNV